MARIGWDVLAVSLDDSGGTPTDISAYVTEIDGLEREVVTQDVTAAGDDDEAHAPVGLKRAGQVTLRGPYDDTATSLNGICQALVGLATSSTLLITWKSGKTSSVETFLTRYGRKPSKGALHMVEVVLQTTGAVTEV